jgi:hypothetical protein
MPETHSPIKPARPIGFDFPEAIKNIIAGKTVTKLEWANEEIFGVLKDGFLVIHNQTGDHRWIVSEADLVGLDWIVIEKPIEGEIVK